MSQEQRRHTPDQIAQRRTEQARRLRRNQRVARVAAVFTGLGLAAGVGDYIANSGHVEGADSIPALKAALGHVPKGIRSIEPTKDPNVLNVDYVVQAEPEEQMVSAIANDLHALAPNQNFQTEVDMINTYADKPNDVHYQDEFHILVNPHTGDILPRPEPSAGQDS